MFPPGDSVHAIAHWLEREGIRQALVDELPELEDRLQLDDERLSILVPHPTGGYIVIGRRRTTHIVRWVVLVPGRNEPTVHEAHGLEDYGLIVREALNDSGPPADE